MKKKWIPWVVALAVLAIGMTLLYILGPIEGPMPLWMSILPPLVAIAMALLIKEVISSLFVGILDPDTGVLSYCNAGHNAPVLIGKERCFLKVESNLPVGVDTEWKYKGQQLTLAPGKTLLMVTHYPEEYPSCIDHSLSL